MRRSDRLADQLDRLAPARVVSYMNLYTAWVGQWRQSRHQSLAGPAGPEVGLADQPELGAGGRGVCRGRFSEPPPARVAPERAGAGRGT